MNETIELSHHFVVLGYDELGRELDVECCPNHSDAMAIAAQFRGLYAVVRVVRERI